VDRSAAESFAVAMGEALGVPVTVADRLVPAARASDIVITCTTSRMPLLEDGDVAPGAFVAGVGADHPEKHELGASLLQRHTLVTDLTDQCATIGDLHHAIVAGRMHAGAVHAELGELVIGAKPGRRSAAEIVVFDSTGTALQDVAAAAAVYARALELGRGVPVAMA
jgi:ornithine cyclodeaminase/alanine dehydrogenase-like protein (mu-crystallin family)